MKWGQSYPFQKSQRGGQFPGPIFIRDLQKRPPRYGFLPFHTQKTSLLVSDYPEPTTSLLPPPFIFVGPFSPQQLGKESGSPGLPPPMSKYEISLYSPRKANVSSSVTQPVPSRCRPPTIQELGTKVHSPLGIQESEDPILFLPSPPMIQSLLPLEELGGCVQAYSKET